MTHTMFQSGMIVLVVLMILQDSVLEVHSSGILQVGFFLYEFKHNPSTASVDITKQSDVSFAPDKTSLARDDVKNGALSPATSWKVKSEIPGGESLTPRNATESSTSSLWSLSASCNETSSPRPQYQFLLCLDYIHRKPNHKPCHLGKVAVKTFAHLGALGRDLVTFPSAMGTTSNGTLTSNPIIFGFDRWKEPVQLKVHVRCCGVSADQQRQCEETLSYTIHHIPAPFPLSLSPKHVILAGRSRLVLYLLLQCDEHYYGPSCDRKCLVDFPSIEHAFCNMTTGRRQCMPGWQGRECQVDTDECRYNFCKNGAHCANFPPGSFTCQCRLGTSGRLCEKRSPICHTQPCKNSGTCHDSPYGFVCLCSRGFTGYRCERSSPVILNRLTTTNASALHEQDIGNAAYLNNTKTEDTHGKTSGWKDWYTALIVCAFLLLVLILAICCFVKRCVFPYRISSKGSFYSVFISAKSYDNVMYEHDEQNDSIINESILDEMAIYQNIFPHQRQSSHHLSDAGVFVETRRQNPHFHSHLSTPRSSDGGQYIDLINSCRNSAYSDYEGLPNLVDPKRSPFMVHRLSPSAAIKHGPSRLKALQAHRPCSDSLHLPKLLVTQHDQPFPSATTSFSSLADSCDSPRSLPGSFETSNFFFRGHDSPKPVSKLCESPIGFKSNTQEVYAIGGSLTSEDLTSARLSRPRKSFLDRAMPTKRKSSEPKLRAVRRVDSGGYEVPVMLHQSASTSALRHQYTTLRRSKLEEHIYDEIRLAEEEESEGINWRGLGVFTSKKGPKIGHARSRSYTSDGRASDCSDFGRYAKIDEDFWANSNDWEKPRSGSPNDTLSKTQRKWSHGEDQEARYSEEPGLACTRPDADKQAGKDKGKQRSRDPPPTKHLTKRRSPRCHLLRGMGQQEVVEHDGPADRQELAHGGQHDDDSDDDSYEDLCDTDEDMWSNTDYTDVFARHRAAV